VRADVAAEKIDAADDFMAWNDRILDTWKLRIDDMKGRFGKRRRRSP
jgi:hypothetical protein